MVGISLHAHLGLGDPDRVTVTLVLPPTPGILVASPTGPPKYLDLASIARLVLDFGDDLSASAPPPALLPEPAALPPSPRSLTTAHSDGRSRSRSAKGKP